MPLNSPKRPPYWNSTSGFDFDHITAVDMSFCISLRNLSELDHPQQKMTSCRFSRWRISAILDFRGPIVVSLKSPCTTSYRSSINRDHSCDCDCDCYCVLNGQVLHKLLSKLVDITYNLSTRCHDTTIPQKKGQELYYQDALQKCVLILLLHLNFNGCILTDEPLRSDNCFLHE